MIDRLILSNLRRAQAFDRNLRSAAGVEQISEKLVDQIMFTSDGRKRTNAIFELKAELVEHVESDVMPQAERIGETNATDIARKIPKPDISIEDVRRRALFAGRKTINERIKLVRMSIDENANTLDSRLGRYWLDPDVGDQKEKLDRLRDIHQRQEQRRKTYESNVRAFNEGETKTRPAKPDLDYMSEFNMNVKRDIRVQARRVGTDSEIKTFQQRGHVEFLWVVPNAGEACPDCRIRAGCIMDMDLWDRLGRPGTGQTICRDHCFCMLVPKETLKVAASLAISAKNVKAVLATPDQIAILNAHRFGKIF